MSGFKRIQTIVGRTHSLSNVQFITFKLIAVMTQKHSSIELSTPSKVKLTYLVCFENM